MPKIKSHSKDSLAVSAMLVFWSRGYSNTSMDHLVQATGVSRHGIYGDFGNKKALFLASLNAYQQTVVSPAFEQVEQENATIEAIYRYFEHQISLAEQTGLPGPGCLIANTMTEIADGDREILNQVEFHNRRLDQGFLSVLKRQTSSLTDSDLSVLAQTLTVFAQGLWSASRVSSDASSLRATVFSFMSLIQMRLAQ